jgi:hypothetical protein
MDIVLASEKGDSSSGDDRPNSSASQYTKACNVLDLSIIVGIAFDLPTVEESTWHKKEKTHWNLLAAKSQVYVKGDSTCNNIADAQCEDCHVASRSMKRYSHGLQRVANFIIGGDMVHAPCTPRILAGLGLAQNSSR